VSWTSTQEALGLRKGIEKGIDKGLGVSREALLRVAEAMFGAAFADELRQIEDVGELERRLTEAARQ